MVEACIAVTMAFFLVFRSFFVGNTSGPKSEQDDAYYKNKQKYNWRRKWTGIDTKEMGGLPKIPCVILMGMRTFICREKKLDQSIMHSKVLEKSNNHSKQTLTRT